MTKLCSIRKAIIELRLRRWGNEENREAERGVGYPRRISIERVLVSQGLAVRRSPAVEAELWETGKAVAQLDPRQRLAIKAKWVWTGPMVDRYKRAQMSQPRFSQLYRAALLKIDEMLP